MKEENLKEKLIKVCEENIKRWEKSTLLDQTTINNIENVKRAVDILKEDKDVTIEFIEDEDHE